MQTIRCSDLPRTMKCPGWLTIHSDLVIGSSGDDAALGTAAHELYAKMVVADCPASQELTGFIAQKHGVAVDDLARLLWGGWNIWKEISGRLEVIGVELERVKANFADGVTLTGHLDLQAQDVETGDLVVLDWKSGHLESDYHDQLMGYAYLAMLTQKEIENVLVMTAYTALGVTSVRRYARSQIMDWYESLARTLQEPVKPFRPGTVCVYCPHATICPARRRMLCAAADDVSAIIKSQSFDASRGVAKLAALKPQVDVLRKALEAYDKQLKDAVKSCGAVPLNEDEELFLRVEERKVAPFDGRLRAVLEDARPGLFEELRAAQTISKSALAQAITGSGKGKLLKAVDDAGVWSVERKEVLATRKIQKEIESE